jgi:plastocyanin
MGMLRITSIATIIWTASVIVAWADSVTVLQEGKKFSEEAVTVKRGQTVTFTNKDQITHNVFSTTPGMAFDLKTQHPGESREVTFDKAGQADVMCAIHPQMKMKVEVTE